MAINSFDVGDLVRLTADFTNIAGTHFDPAAVFCKVKTPAGVTTTYQYSVDVSVVKDSTGVYHLDVDANLPGNWQVRWYSTGTGQAAAEDVFHIKTSQF